jgi:DNA modification methylase
MNEFININCLDGLKELPSESVNCCITSPPYYGLRDYGHDDQIGCESSPEEYLERITNVFREVRRVLRKDGTLWLNLGDSYNGSGKGIGDTTISKQTTNKGSRNGERTSTKIHGLKPKDLIGIPWMVAFALRAEGWYLRQDIIWNKPNPMPESVRDRCTKSHEYIFLLSKSQTYYFDQEAILEKLSDASISRLSQAGINEQAGSARVPGKTNGNMKAVKRGNIAGDMSERGIGRTTEGLGLKSIDEKLRADGKRNKRSVWTVTTRPFSDAHFATFPERLIVDMIKAGCPEGGIVLDPFSGAGTTALVARKLHRNFIAFELNDEYIKIAESRLRKELGMFA